MWDEIYLGLPLWAGCILVFFICAAAFIVICTLLSIRDLHIEDDEL